MPPRRTSQPGILNNTLKDLRRGVYLGIIAVPPARAWEGRDPEDPRVAIGLRSADNRAESVDTLAAALVCSEAGALNIPWAFAHPAPPQSTPCGANEADSADGGFWRTELAQQLLDLGNAEHLITLDQCTWGGVETHTVRIASSFQLEQRARGSHPAGTHSPKGELCSSTRHDCRPICADKFVPFSPRKYWSRILERTPRGLPYDPSDEFAFARSALGRTAGERIKAPPTHSKWDERDRWSEVYRVRWVRPEPPSILMLTISISFPKTRPGRRRTGTGALF